MNQQSNTLQHGADMADDFLAHYGVLGMKWGKRKGLSRVSADKKIARLKKANKRTKGSEELRIASSRSTAARSVYGNVISGAKGLHGAGQFAKARKLTEKGSANRKTANLGAGLYGAIGAVNVAAGVRTTKRLNSNYYETKAKATTKRRVDKRNKKIKNIRSRITHGDILADNFLAHYGGVKSKGGVTHDNNDTLSHYGVLGMQWGKRKGSSGSRSEKKTSRQLAKADKKFVKTANKTSSTLALKIYNDAANNSQAAYAKINSNPKYKKKFNWDSPGKYENDYLRVIDKTFVKLLDDATKANTKGNTKSASGRYELSIDTSGAFIPVIKVKDNKIKHADEQVPFKLKFDKSGKMIGIVMTDSIQHGAELTDDFLSHYGVLGMKWGKRKGSSGASVKKAKKNPKASTMSDAELRTKINRLQMEKQYKQLTTKDRSAASRFVGDIVRESAKKTVSSYVSDVMKTGVDAGIGAAKKSKSYDKGRTLAGNAKSMIKKRKGS